MRESGISTSEFRIASVRNELIELIRAGRRVVVDDDGCINSGKLKGVVVIAIGY